MEEEPERNVSQTSLPRLNRSRSLRDDELLNTILPSYHMFRATVSQRLVPSEESFKEDPPRYELSPINSLGLTPVISLQDPVNPASHLSAALNGLMGIEGDEDGEDVYNQNSADFWDKTVLANVHKLDNLKDGESPIASMLDVNVTFTESVCKIGVRPDIIDLSSVELCQGDFIHGFVTIKNNWTAPIPFDMVYVACEGILCVKSVPADVKEQDLPPVVYKFLNMLDLYASWSYANIDRLATDRGDPHDWCEGETDPLDNTVLSINVKRTFMPGITYKRFFSFRIPERLLDDCCDIHSLDAHCQLPPTLGQAYNLNDHKNHFSKKGTFKDFSPMNSFVGYSVSARVIGRGSQYGLDLKQDKYVLVSESHKPFRVIPQTIQQLYPKSHNNEVNACFADLKTQIASKIELGQLVAAIMKTGSAGTLSSFSPLSTNTSRSSLNLLSDKVRHLYVLPSRGGSISKKSEEKYYRHISSFKKKGITGSIKGSGTLYLSTPQTTYTLPYIPPLEYRNPFQGYKTTFRVPIEISYVCDKNDGGTVLPTIKEISSELIVLTISSRKHEIPIEFNHEMCFDDEIVDDMGTKRPEDISSFESKVIRPFQAYYSTLIHLMKTIGFNDSAFRVETKLFKDVKCLAMLQTKKIILPISNVSIYENKNGVDDVCSSQDGIAYELKSSPINENFDIYSKSLEVEVDLKNCQWHTFANTQVRKGLDLICLVPNFQKCFISRIYYLKLTVKYRHGVTQVLHLPISIAA